MNRPDNSLIPGWANWIAMDRDGEWWAYENRPEIQYDEEFLSRGRKAEITQDKNFDNFASTLEKIIRE